MACQHSCHSDSQPCSITEQSSPALRWPFQTRRACERSHNVILTYLGAMRRDRLEVLNEHIAVLHGFELDVDHQ